MSTTEDGLKVMKEAIYSSPALSLQSGNRRLASPQQRRYHAVHQPVVSHFSEVITAVVDLPPDTSTGLIAAAAKDIVNRHDGLRVSFHQFGSDLWQVEEQEITVHVEEVDLSSRDQPWQSELDESMRVEASRLYDPRLWPLFRIKVIRLPTGKDICFLHIYHLAFDGQSRRIFERDLPTAIERLQRGDVDPRPLPFAYRAYCEWANAREQSADYHDAQLYWRREFSGSFEPFHLSPSDKGGLIDTVAHGYVFRMLQLAPTLSDIAANCNCSVFSLLLSSFAAWLMNWTGRDHTAIGISTSGRDHPDVNDVIGLFTNTVVLRAESTENPKALVETTHRKLALSLKHQCYQYDRIVLDLDLEFTLDRLPLTGVYFTSHKLHPRRPFREGELEYGYVDGGNAKFDLLTYYQIFEGDLVFSFKYRKAAFPGDNIATFAAGYRDFLMSWLTHLDDRGAIRHAP